MRDTRIIKINIFLFFGQEHILKLSRLLQRFRADNATAEDEDVGEIEKGDDELEQSLNVECRASLNTEATTEIDLKMKLLSVANVKTRMDSKTDVLKYWESKKYDGPELYCLAMVALSVPCTQVSVERCFSAVKLLLEDHRLKLGEEKLDDLMIIRLNLCLLPEAVKRRQV